MTFTDKHLSILKEFLNDLEPELRDLKLNGVSIAALIARLEAAELKGLEADRLRAFRGTSPEYIAFDAADVAWRKAAGK